MESELEDAGELEDGGRICGGGVMWWIGGGLADEGCYPRLRGDRLRGDR